MKPMNIEKIQMQLRECATTRQARQILEPLTNSELNNLASHLGVTVPHPRTGASMRNAIVRRLIEAPLSHTAVQGDRR